MHHKVSADIQLVSCLHLSLILKVKFASRPLTHACRQSGMRVGSRACDRGGRARQVISGVTGDGVYRPSCTLYTIRNVERTRVSWGATKYTTLS